MEYYFTSVSRNPESNTGVYGYATMDFDSNSDDTNPIESSINYNFFNSDSTNIAELEVKAIYEAISQGISKSLDFTIVTHHYCSVKAINKLLQNDFNTDSQSRRSSRSACQNILKKVYSNIAKLINESNCFKGFIIVKAKSTDDISQIEYIQSHNSNIDRLTALRMSEGNKISSNAMYAKVSSKNSGKTAETIAVNDYTNSYYDWLSIYE